MITNIFKNIFSSLPGGISAHIISMDYFHLSRNFWDDLFYFFVILVSSILSGIFIQIYRDCIKFFRKKK
jgi:hypothetical protein